MDLVESGQLSPGEVFRHWYFCSKYEMLRCHLDSLPTEAREGTLADFGCGAGVFLTMLEREGFMTSGQMLGIDNSPLASSVALMGKSAIVPSFPLGRQFDIVLAMDVLEHCADDRAVLESLMTHCRPGGWIFITVPAHQWLWSGHDEHLGHHRRYSLWDVRSLVARVPGLSVRSIHYHHLLLLLPVVLYRLIGRSWWRREGSDIHPHSSMVNKALLALCRLELGWSSLNRLAGVTVAAVCQKAQKGAMP